MRTKQKEYQCLGVLLATGAYPRTIGFRGEEEYKGRGVAYCATCDGEFFTGKDVFVVGGGYAAAEESVFLTKYARHVTVLVRKNDFSCAASVAERAKKHEKITVLTHTILEEVAGENGLNYARYKNTVTGEVTEIKSPEGESFGVFVFAGYSPDTKLLEGLVELNEQGYIVTDAVQKTNIPGVYAAGDVCIKPLRQVITAAGDGALAATELEKYVAELQRKTGLRTERPAMNQKEKHEEDAMNSKSDELFSGEMKQQLDLIFSKMEHPLLLQLYLDESQLSNELKEFITGLADQTDKLTVYVSERDDQPGHETPCVVLCQSDGTETGLAFHGVPGGHEFSSFMLGLYNVAGSGQPVSDELRASIKAIQQPIQMKVLVTLSCTMCPELVTAAQRIAAENPNVTAHVYDIRHFESLRERYQVMSVPCLIINEEQVSFGKKNLEQLLQLLESTFTPDLK